MATKESKEAPANPPASAPLVAGANPKVTWDDSKMRTAYANVCNVMGTREEIMLLFGANQAWQGGQKEIRVLLSDRVVLNPFAAKRLYRMLEQGLKEYEGRFGELKV
jgi:lysophospholipase L1-like esterase